MSWSRTTHRHRLAHAVLADIEASGEPVLPARWRSEVDAEFGGFGPFLRDVQARWYRAFDARLDALLEDRPVGMRAALGRLWSDLADAMPATRFLLDAHTAHPALAALHERHRRMLRDATGIDAMLIGELDDHRGPAVQPAGARLHRRPISGLWPHACDRSRP